MWIAFGALAGLATIVVGAHAQTTGTPPSPTANCTVTAMNRTAPLQPDYSFTIYNIPGAAAFFGPGTLAPAAPFRVRAVCSDGTTGETALAFPELGSTVVYTGEIFWRPSTPLPLGLTVAPAASRLTGGQSTQLTTTGVLEKGTTIDVTPRAKGTFYTSSNPLIADVSQDGLVTVTAGFANGSAARVVMTAQHEGVAGSTLLQLGPRGRLGGRVLRPDGVTGVAGAQVSILRSQPRELVATVTTDASGQFLVDDISAGAFELSVIEPATGDLGRGAGSLQAEGEAATVDVKLNGQGTVTVSVVDGANAPVPNAAVTFTSLSGLRDFRSVQTDAAGQVVLERALAGRFTVSTRDPSSNLVGTAVGELAVGGKQVVTLKLQPVGAIAGSVRASDGITVQEGVQVRLVSAVRGIVTQAITAEDGRFRFDALPLSDGPYTLDAMRDGRLKARVPNLILSGAGQELTQDVVFGAAGLLRGVVTRSGGVRAADVAVTVQSQVGQRFSFSTRTDAQGRYAIDGVPVGAFGLTANAGNGEVGTAGGNIAADADIIEVNLQLAANGVVGTVFGRDGRTPVGAGVAVSLQPGGLVTQTSAQGQFGFSIAQPGTYTIEAVDGAAGNRGRTQVVVTAITPGEPKTADVVFLGRGTVSGQVRDPNGVTQAGVPVRFTSSGEFKDEHTVTTDAQGRYELQGMFVGEFSVYANNPSSKLAGVARGRIMQDGQQLTADITLDATGSVTGKVVAVDGSTPVPGATVELYIAGARALAVTADATGGFSFAAVPLGEFMLRAANTTDGDRGQVVSRIAALNEQRTVNVRLLGMGTVYVKALDGANAPVAGATVQLASYSLFGGSAVAVTGSDGTASFARVFNGDFGVTAEKGAGVSRLSASGSGTLVNGKAPELVLSMANRQVGSVSGTVLKALKAEPLAGVEVRLLGGGIDRTVVSDAEGKYRFDQVEVNVDHRLTVVIGGRTRARTDVRLAAADENQQRNLTLLGVGSVSGRVVNAQNVAQGGVRITLGNSDPTYGGTWVVTTQADGSYAIADVPAGNFTLRASSNDGRLQAQDSGQIRFEADALVKDLTLVDSAVNLPVALYDANGTSFDLQGEGSVGAGMNQVFTGNGNADVRAARLEVVVNGVAVPFQNGDGSIGRLTQAGQLLEVDELNVASGLNVTRRVYVPKNGYFARYLEVLENRTSGPITVGVRVTSNYAAGVVGARVVDTSNNDTVLSVQGASRDRWLVVDDDRDGDPFLGVSSETPSVATVFDGAGGTVQASDARVTALGPVSKVMVEWADVTVQPGSSVALMHVLSQQLGRIPARVAAERLVQLPPEVLEGLSPEERLMVANFKLPADGLSSLEALPPVEGNSITGTVYAGDGATPIGGTRLRIKGQHPLFGRTYSVVADEAGKFTLQAGEFGTSRVVAIAQDRYTVEATHPHTRAVATAEGRFTAGQPTQGQDMVFVGTGNLRGSVKRHTGAAVTSGTAMVPYRFPGDASATSKLSTPIQSDGTYQFTGITPADYLVSVSQPHPQGKALLGTAAGAVAVPAGTTTLSDAVIEDTGEVTGTVLAANGEPVVGAFVQLDPDPIVGPYRSTQTDTGGNFRMPDVRVGPHVVQASGNGGLMASASVVVAKDTPSVSTLKLAGTAQLQVTVRHARGVAAANATVAANGRYAVTNGAGEATFEVPADLQVGITAYHPDNSSLTVTGTAKVTDNGGVGSITLDLPAAGSVTGVVLRPDGATPAGSVQILLRRVDGRSVNSTWTDATGRYSSVGLPPMAYTVSAEDRATFKFADADFTVLKDGDEQVVNLTLADNRIPLPANLLDGNNFRYDVQPQGHVGKGWREPSVSWGYDVNVFGNGAAQLEINEQSFTGDSSALLEAGRRQFAIAQPTPLAGLNVTRKIYVPRGGYFARYLEVLENPGTTPLTVSVKVKSRYSNSGVGLSVASSSSGDTVLQSGAQRDLWAMLDDSEDTDPFVTTSIPPTGMVLSNAGASLPNDTFVFDNTARTLEAGWAAVTVPAGGRKILMHFQVQQVNRAGARAAAERLVQLPPEALQSLTDEERAGIANFVLPADGQSSMAALPSLAGAVSGRVFEGDARTAVPNTYVQVRSTHPLFGRLWQNISTSTCESANAAARAGLISAQDGSYSLSGSLADRGSIALPVGFDIEVQANTVYCGYDYAVGHRITHVPSPVSTARFAPGTSAANTDVVFATGVLTGTVVGPFDYGVASGSVSTVVNERNVSVQVANGGAYVLPGLPGGSYDLKASVPHNQGTSLVGERNAAGAVTGQVVVTDIPVEATGAVGGVAVTANGEASVGSAVTLSASGNRYVFRSTTTDSLGRFNLSAVPVGQYTLSITDARTHAVTRSDVAVTSGQISNQSVTLLGTGSMQLTVNYARGTGAVDVPVYLTASAAGGEYLVGRTDAQGRLGFLVPVGDFSIRVRHPSDSSGNDWKVLTGAMTANNEQQSRQLNLDARAAVQISVVDADAANAPLANASVYLKDGACSECYKGRTDGSGRLLIGHVWAGSYTVIVRMADGRVAQVSGTIEATNDGQTLEKSLSVTAKLDAFGVSSFGGQRQLYSVRANAGDTISVSIAGAPVNGQPSAYLTRTQVYDPQKREVARGYGYDSRNSFLQYNELGDLKAVPAQAEGYHTVVVSPYYATYLGGFRLQLKVNGVPVEALPYADGGAVNGLVTRADGTTPMVGQTVQVRSLDTLAMLTRVATGADGRYTFPAVPAGWAEVTAIEPTNVRGIVSRSGEVIAGQATALDLTLPVQTAVALQVKVEGTGLSVPSQIPVNIVDSVGNREGGVVTFTGGSATSNVASIVGYGDKFTVSVVHPANARISAAAEVSGADGQTRTVSLTLAVASLRGRTLDAAGAVVPNARVELRRAADGVYLSGTYSDSSGVYVFSEVPAGQELAAQVVDPNTDLRTSTRVTPATGQAVNLDLRLTPLGSVAGTVRRSSGAPLANAYVRATYVYDDVGGGTTSRGAQTDAEGHYRIDLLPTGQLLRIDAEYYTPSQTVTASSSTRLTSQGEVATADLTVDVPGGALRVKVRGADGSLPDDRWCQRVSVRPSAGSGEEGSSENSQYYVDCVDNWAVFDILPPGEVVVDGYLGYDVPFGPVTAMITNGQVTDVTATLSIVKGVVRHADGSAAQNTTVSVETPERTYRGSTNEGGEFTVYGVPAGDHRLRAQDNTSGLWVEAPFTFLDVSAPLQLNVTLPASGSLSGVLRNQANQPVPSAWVYVRSSGLDLDRQVMTDEQGRYSVPNVALGNLTITAVHPTGLNVATASAVLGALGQSVTVDLQFPAAGAVSGTLRKADGSVVANAEVQLRLTSPGTTYVDGYRSTRTDAAGMFGFTDITPGGVRVTATDPSDYRRLGIEVGAAVAGENVAIDVVLGNGTRLWTNLRDEATGYTFEIDGTGAMYPYIPSVGQQPFDGYGYRLSVGGMSFPYNDSALLFQDGRELQIGPVNLAGLTVSRRLFVPAPGGYARVLETLTNLGASEITVPVELVADYRAGTEAQLLVDPAANGNRYALYAQGGVMATPAAGYVMAGSGGGVEPSTAIFGGGAARWSWNLTVAPGQTVRLLNYSVIRRYGEEAAARTQAESLRDLGVAGQLQGLDVNERSQIRNFAAP